MNRISSGRDIDHVLGQAVKTTKIPGVVALAATSDGVVYEGAFGCRELGGSAAMTPDTVGYIASMTKALTATAAMQLVERGKLQLGVPVATVLPELADARVLVGFDDSDAPIMRPAKNEITLRHLLTHTSGFGYEIWNDRILKYQAVTGTPSIFTSENAALRIPLLFDPGERWEYGIGIDWVGKMVEAVSGQRLGDYMDENLFGPLGMTSTSFDISINMRNRMARLHARRPDGSLSVVPWEFKQETEFQQGGGGLYGSMQDYLRFTRMIMQRGEFGGSQILRPETVENMVQNHIGSLDVQEMKTAIPKYSNDANFFPGMKQKWGLSFLINTERTPEGRSAGSIAWAGLSNCYFWIDLAKQVTGVFMTQIFPFFDDDAVNLFRRYETAVYQSLCQV